MNVESFSVFLHQPTHSKNVLGTCFMQLHALQAKEYDLEGVKAGHPDHPARTPS